MSTPEPFETDTATLERSTAEAEIEAGIDKAKERAANFAVGAQRLMLEEWVFATNELLERARTEAHLFSEFISKVAGVHSVKGLRTMFEECGKHQIGFVRRDCDRVFRHGERVFQAASNLFNTHPLN